MIKRANQKKKKGFSLIELIIVLAVMAIIALIAIPNFNAVKENSKVKADKQSLETVKRTVMMLTADDQVSVTKDVVVTYKVGSDTITVTPDTELDNDETAVIVSQLKGMDGPQEKDKNAYQFTISTDGTISDLKTVKAE